MFVWSILTSSLSPVQITLRARRALTPHHLNQRRSGSQIDCLHRRLCQDDSVFNRLQGRYSVLREIHGSWHEHENKHFCKTSSSRLFPLSPPLCLSLSLSLVLSLILCLSLFSSHLSVAYLCFFFFSCLSLCHSLPLYPFLSLRLISQSLISVFFFSPPSKNPSHLCLFLSMFHFSLVHLPPTHTPI